jgi:hypothetical protein
MTAGLGLAVRIIAACAFALAVVGCTTEPPKATEQERKEATEPFIICLHAAIARLDDGKSDAQSIALAARPSCAAEFARATDTYARGLNPAATVKFHRYDDETYMGLATAAVLDERAKRRR